MANRLDAARSDLTAVFYQAARRSLGTWRDLRGAANIAGSHAVSDARLRAVAAGLAAPEVAVFECARGADVSGLFSEVAAVIGMLDYYERWQQQFAGLKVVFGDGLYFDPQIGPNWWDYYFEPIDFRRGSGRERVVSPYFHDWCAFEVERTFDRRRAAAIVQRHVRVRASVQQIVDRFIAAEWRSGGAIGVHYRGTDKYEDAPRVAYADIAAVIASALGEQPSSCRIFLATDEQAFVEFMSQQFGDRVTYRQMFRSTDGRPIDVVNHDGNHQKGLDAVVDCMLLSRSNFLIRTASNLSMFSTFFNLQMPELLLNPERTVRARR